MALPVLEDVRIATPCHVSWESMTGDERKRFCGACKLDVYDLSGLTRAEAEALVFGRAAAGQRTCVRLWRRADGTVLTQDCPPARGLGRGWGSGGEAPGNRDLARVRRRVARMGLALGAMLLALVGASGARAWADDAPPGEGAGAKIKRWIAGSWGSPTPTPYPGPMMGDIAVPIATLAPTPKPVAAHGKRKHGKAAVPKATPTP